MKSGIYVAGPMTGIPEFNFPAFHDAARRLADAGWRKIGNPAEWDESNGLDTKGLTGNEKPGDPKLGTFDLAEALTMDLTWIAKNAVAIALLPGWENSKGTAAEVALGKALGLEIRPVDEFILTEGDKVWVKDDAKRSDVFPGEGSRVQGCVATIYEPLDPELELYVESDDDSCYVRFQDVLPFKPEPKITVAELHAALAKNASTTIGTFDAIEALEGEVRVTSETGGQKGSKLARFDMIPTDALWELAEQFGKGAIKYRPVNGLDNWRNGYPWSLSFAAAFRHLTSAMGGQDIDPETGSKEVIAVAWHMLTLAHQMNKPEMQAKFDDRQDVLDRAA